MAGSLPARLSAGEGRKFGVTVGLAFLALAALMGWRGAATVGVVLATLGGTLVAAGLLVPTRLGPIERAWMRMAQGISKVTTPILMGVIYFGILTPVGLIRRAMGHNSLARRPGSPGLAPGGFWVEREAGKRRSDLRRQY